MSLFNAQVAPMKHTYDPVFEQAYIAFPRHVGKDAAARAWKSAIRKAEPGVILAAVVAFASSPAGRMGRLTPHMSTWLNAGRWQDDPVEWHRGGDPKQIAKDKAMDDAAVYARYQALPPERRAEIRMESMRADPDTTNRMASIVHFARKAGV